MNALHLTSHIGTKKTIQNVFNFLNIENRLITQRCINNSYYYDETTSNEIWDYYSDKLDNISVLIFTDTSMIARPFLQNIEKHNCLIVIYITNRFDWGIWGFTDDFYYKLYSELSNHNRVIFCADNNYDQYYAKLYNIKFLYDDSIKLTPLISENIILPNKNKFFVYNRGTKINQYEQYLKTINIEYDIYGEEYDRFKNNESICEYKAFIHLPYQTNIQSLWENLGYFIIYYIPSKKFITELLNKKFIEYFQENNYNCENIIELVDDIKNSYKDQIFLKRQIMPQEEEENRKLIKKFYPKIFSTEADCLSFIIKIMNASSDLYLKLNDNVYNGDINVNINMSAIIDYLKSKGYKIINLIDLSCRSVDEKNYEDENIENLNKFSQEEYERANDPTSPFARDKGGYKKLKKTRKSRKMKKTRKLKKTRKSLK